MDSTVIHFFIPGKTSGSYNISAIHTKITDLTLTVLSINVHRLCMNTRRVLLGVTIGLVLGFAFMAYRRRRTDQGDTPKRARLDDGKEVGIIKL
jgi:hypothetical protein